MIDWSTIGRYICCATSPDGVLGSIHHSKVNGTSFMPDDEDCGILSLGSPASAALDPREVATGYGYRLGGVSKLDAAAYQCLVYFDNCGHEADGEIEGELRDKLRAALGE